MSANSLLRGDQHGARERDVLLASVQIAVFEAAGGYGSWEGYFDDSQVWHPEDLHVFGRDAVELAYRLGVRAGSCAVRV